MLRRSVSKVNHPAVNLSQNCLKYKWPVLGFSSGDAGAACGDTMKYCARAFGAALFAAFLLSSAANASSFLVQIDDLTDQVFVDTYQDGTLIQHYQSINPESVSPAIDGTYRLWNSATLSASFDFAANVLDTDGVTLSDTVKISGTQGDNFFGISFFSDIEGGPPLTPIDAGFITETGDWQSAPSTVSASNGDIYSFQFRSDVEATPIPAALPLFASGAGLIGFLARRRKQKRAA